MAAVAEAVADGRLPGRVWMYSNYHCNLACTYCLTDSAPSSPRRLLPAEAMLRVAGEARDLGFTGLGVTGGEPFLLPWLPDLLAEHQIVELVVTVGATLLLNRLCSALALPSSPETLARLDAEGFPA